MPLRVRMCAWLLVTGALTSVGVRAQDRPARDLIDLIVRDGPRAVAIRAGTGVVAREQEARLVYPNPAVIYSREGAGFTEFLQVEQPLPIFGSRGALARAGAAAVSAAEAEREARLRDLRADAAVAVARVQAEQVRVEIADAHAAAVGRLMEVLRTREREGEGSRFDRLRAEQEFLDARRAASSAAVELASARATLQALLPAGTPIPRLTDPLLVVQATGPVEALVERAEDRRADLRALVAAGNRASLEAEAARRSRRPAPTLFGGLKRADAGSGRESGGVLGVSVAVPLFDGGSREAARWTADRLRLDAERTALLHEIRAEISRAHDVLVLRQAAVTDDDPAAADELLRIAEIAYREGEAGILELIDALRTAAAARLRGLDSLLDARLAQIALEHAVGDTLWP